VQVDVKGDVFITVIFQTVMRAKPLQLKLKVASVNSSLIEDIEDTSFLNRVPIRRFNIAFFLSLLTVLSLSRVNGFT
jgi:hypothetical protein